MSGANGFGPFDVRAIVGEGFDASTFYRLGRAWAQMALADTESTSRWVSIGRDARVHSEALSAALVAGLQAEGLQVLDLGLAPTPLVYYSQWLSTQSKATHPERPDTLPELMGCLVVTASHNPAEYNGLKFSLDNQPPTREQMDAWQERFHETCANDMLHAEPDCCLDLSLAYCQTIQTEFNGLGTGLHVVLDGSNGAGGPLAVQALEAIGASVTPLYCEPDGTFPNHPPDPCRAEHLQALATQVKALKADWGLCLDGDADRLGAVDETGAPISNDTLLAALASAYLKGSPEQKAIVCEIKAPEALLHVLRNAGGQPILSKTGHVFMKRQMKESQSMVGGELSGHFFFRDRHPGYDDAIYTACRLLEGYKTLLASQLQTLLPKTCLSPELRLPCPKEQHAEVVEAFAADLQSGKLDLGLSVLETLTLDGVRVNLDGGFCLLRQSNTEPVVSLRFETTKQADFSLLGKALTDWFDSQLGDAASVSLKTLALV